MRHINNASSSGDTSRIHPYLTQSGWLSRLHDFEREGKSEHLKSRVWAIIVGLRDIPKYLPDE